MVIITLILIIAILLIIHKNKKFKTIEECNKFLYNCKNKQRYIQVLKERANLYEEQENYHLNNSPVLITTNNLFVIRRNRFPQARRRCRERPFRRRRRRRSRWCCRI